MHDYSDHKYVQELIKKAQEADSDNREKVREANLFLNKRDGQWEPFWWSANTGKPRYTFDLSNPIVDQIAGEMEQASFNINVKPAGGEATKEIAQTYDGLIRNIENMSNATSVFNNAARSMVASGMDGWRVVQKYVDSDSFDQDLIIQPIANFVDRVWFDTSAEMQDKSDANWCVVLQTISPEEYKYRWPEGSEQSVDQDRTAEAYSNKADAIIVGEFCYKKKIDRELVLMSNGAVYEVDDDLDSVLDELAAQQITEVNRRKRKKDVVYIRKFDASGWLEKEQETVFEFLPVIPSYANFKIIENKTIYWGAVEKFMDAQRVLNYSVSREIEEGSLAPRAKYWMTEKQAVGHEKELATLNTNADPVQFYNHDPEMPGVPQQNGGAQINPGLRVISDAMSTLINQSAGMFAANMGDNPGLQSGVAIDKLQTKGNNGTIKYFKAQEVAICHTARILIKAMPKVYSKDRQVRLLKEDGSFEMKTLGEQVHDQESNKMVTLNDLSQGQYDVTCSSGASFQNKQQETVAAITEITKYNPAIAQVSGDILTRNVDAPAMDLLADRLRALLINQGAIPFDQMTDEEKQAAQQKAQSQQQAQDPNAMIGQAELMKAQNEANKLQVDTQIKQIELQQKQEGLQLKNQELQLQLEKAQNSAGLEQDKFDFDKFVTMQKAQFDQNKAMVDALNTNAATFKVIKEAMSLGGFDPVSAEQASLITENQQLVDGITPNS